MTGNRIALSASQWVCFSQGDSNPKEAKGTPVLGVGDGASSPTAGRSPGCRVTLGLAPGVASETRPALGEAGLGQPRLGAPEFVL